MDEAVNKVDFTPLMKLHDMTKAKEFRRCNPQSVDFWLKREIIPYGSDLT